MPKKMKLAKPMMIAPTVKKQAQSKRHAGTYDTMYKRLRNVVMKSNPLCQHRGEKCQGFSSECHHLLYPATALHHLLAVCHECHMDLEREK